jgi:syntaxin 8
MSSLTTASQRLTTVSSLILERSRVLSLGLTPSPTTDTKIGRVLRQVRDELVRLGDGQGGEEWGRWEGLVKMMQEDEMGRKQVAGLERPVPEPV